MTTVEFSTALFYEVDEQMRAMPKHPEAHVSPSEVVILGLLHALKGVGNRALSQSCLFEGLRYPYTPGQDTSRLGHSQGKNAMYAPGWVCALQAPRVRSQLWGCRPLRASRRCPAGCRRVGAGSSGGRSYLLHGFQAPRALPRSWCDAARGRRRQPKAHRLPRPVARRSAAARPSGTRVPSGVATG
jgi:hypothetical protein